MNRTTQERRLRHLETLAGMGDAFERDGREVLAWMSQPSMVTVIVATAHITAERRWCVDHGRDACGRDPWGGIVLGREHGWLWQTDHETRDALMYDEIKALDRLIAIMPFADALRCWCDDTDGLAPYWHDTDSRRFRDQLRRDRARMRGPRSASDAHGREWRRRHPEWRPGMSDADYDRWELDLLGLVAA
jgi:hypothetical protein